MVVLFIDTCNRELAIGLSIDNKLVYKKEYDAFKRQSEVLAREVVDCLKINNIEAKDIDKVVVTNGPGSYTGIRIGLTFAKVFTSVLNKELVVVSSLKALAGKKEKTIALIDARSKRAYYGIYDMGKCLKEDSVDYLANIDINGYNLVGDTYLFDKENENSIIDNMFDIYNDLESVSDPKSANAIYLKD